MCADAGLSIEETAKALHVTTRTLRYWISGRVAIPYAAYRLVRILGRFELPDPAWAGWIMHSGRLWSPEGHGFVPGDSNWWGRLVSQARLWREQYDREAQFRALMWRAGRAEPGLARPRNEGTPGQALALSTGAAGRGRSLPADGSCPNLFIGHISTERDENGARSEEKAENSPAPANSPCEKRGDGGRGPHGGQEQASSDLVRGPGSALPGSRPCPEKHSSKASK
jgi:hypothetical protein